jgi:hypothetical protein
MEEKEYKIYLYTILAIENSITVVCFTLLAIVFKIWWIVLLSALFTTYIKKNENRR